MSTVKPIRHTARRARDLALRETRVAARAAALRRREAAVEKFLGNLPRREADVRAKAGQLRRITALLATVAAHIDRGAFGEKDAIALDAMLEFLGVTKAPTRGAR